MTQPAAFFTTAREISDIEWAQLGAVLVILLVLHVSRAWLNRFLKIALKPPLQLPPESFWSQSFDHENGLSLDPDALEKSIALSEARFNIRKGAEKTIRWAGKQEVRAKTPLSVLYIHGWSACRQEIYPMPERIAEHLGANLFCARLSGHGFDVQDEDAKVLGYKHPLVSQATASNLFMDTISALETALILGNRVVMVGFSTGGALATWAASHPRYRDKIAALILISPAFGIAHPLFGALQWIDAVLRRLPMFGERVRRNFLELAQGDLHYFPPLNEPHDRYWTHSYPTVALLNLSDVLWHVSTVNSKLVGAPVFLAASPKDQTASFKSSVRRFWEFPNKHKKFLQVDDNDHLHVIAGDILSPKLTGRIVDASTAFLDSLNVVSKDF